MCLALMKFLHYSNMLGGQDISSTCYGYAKNGIKHILKQYVSETSSSFIQDAQNHTDEMMNA